MVPFLNRSIKSALIVYGMLDLLATHGFQKFAERTSMGAPIINQHNKFWSMADRHFIQRPPEVHEEPWRR